MFPGRLAATLFVLTSTVLLSTNLAGVLQPSDIAGVQPPAPACVPGQHFPGPQRPFVFIHIEKCGGSTIRGQLAAYASAHGVFAYVPCFLGVPCTSRLDAATATDLLQGARIWANHHEHWLMYRFLPAADFDCFVVLRDPDARTVSHFLYFENLKGFDNLSDAEILAKLDSGIFPVESGNLITMKLHHEETPWDVRNLTLAKRTLDRCVVGIKERWNETLLVLGARFPWLAPHITHTVENAQSYTEEKKRLARLLKAKIQQRRMNSVDWEAYRYAWGKFEEQLKDLGIR